MRLVATFAACVAVNLGTDATQAAVGAGSRSKALVRDVTSFVNPFVGTGGLGSLAAGHTFPGAVVPFGMVQFSPVSGNGGGPGGYDYDSTTVKGFALTRMSGTGCANYGNFPFLPLRSVPIRVEPRPSSLSIGFSHALERASPGGYEVKLNSGIDVALTATLRTGVARFRFPVKSNRGHVLVDAGASANGRDRSGIRITPRGEVAGWERSTGFCGGPVYPTTYFVARFDRPFVAYATWGQDGILTPNVPQRDELNTAGAVLTFDTANRPEITARIGISFVSLENARKNLEAESEALPYAAVRARSRAAWQRALSAIDVRTDDQRDLRIFYTALYHALLHPNVFSDVNGEYVGQDQRVHVARGYARYTNVAGWDAYRTQIPLLALLAPRRLSDIVRSLVEGARESGILSKWLMASWDSGVMIGDSADAIIASAHAFGARRYDARAALAAMVDGATQPVSGPFSYPSSNAAGPVQRQGLQEYLELGYVPIDHGQGFIWGPSAATLEYAVDDFAISRLARSLGDRKTAETFSRRSMSWRNVFNTRTRRVEPRRADGAFLEDVEPLSETGFAEGNSWQYTWLAPHDVAGLIERLGGPRAARARLDFFFRELNAGPSRPYAWMGNEPSFGAPWIYLWMGAPAKTQAVVDRILTNLFRSSPRGLPGDDDAGALSSWYVWASIGLYPAIPGVGGFAVGKPRFAVVSLRLPSGRTIRLTRSGAGPYVAGLRLGGKPYNRTWLPLAQLERAAGLDFELAKRPSRWGTGNAARPPSFGRG